MEIKEFEESVYEVVQKNKATEASYIIDKMIVELISKSVPRKEISKILVNVKCKFDEEKNDEMSDMILSLLDSLDGWTSPRNLY